jgi:hypothetical protein
VKSEEEWQNGYIDVLMLKRPNVTTKYNFLIELKYVKKGEDTKKDKENIAKVEKEAREQVQKYLQSDNAQRIPNLKAWLFMLVGREWHLVEEIVVP